MFKESNMDMATGATPKRRGATSKAATLDTAPKQGFGRRLLNIPELGVFTAVIVFFGGFVLADKAMAESANIVRMALQGSMIGLAAFGMSFLMLAGEIDLSTGATAGFSAAIAGLLLAKFGWPEWACYGAALLGTVGAGLLNSFVVLKIGMPSFFGTLGTSFAITGLSEWLLKGQWLDVGSQMRHLVKLIAPSPFFGLPWTFLALLAAVIIGDLLVRTSRLGPLLSATGGNRQAAEIVGINVKLVKTLCFIFVSVCCGIGGLFVMAYGGLTDQTIGVDWLLWVIAIAIIGGGSLRGGIGSVVGVLLGTALIQIIKMGLYYANVKTNAQGIVVGAILIGAAALDAIRRKAIQY
jgi:ribose/xylose/arabinose/galactoside ABC-type transport system permease subunit